MEDGQFLLEIGAEEHDRRGVGGLVDRRPVETEDLRGEAISELGVTVGDPDRVGELRPRVGVLVRATRSAEQGHAVGSAGGERVGDHRGGRAQRRVPRRLDEAGLRA